MSQRIKEQRIPIDYLLMQWYKQVAEKQKELKTDFDKVISTAETALLPQILELVKVAGKTKTAGTLATYQECKKTIATLETTITILINCYSDFKHLLNQHATYGDQLTSLDDLKAITERDMSFLRKIRVLLRNIIKASEVVFLPNIRVQKKRDEAFENFSREFIRQIRNLTKDVGSLRAQYDTVSDSLAIELEELIKQIKEQKAAEEAEKSKK